MTTSLWPVALVTFPFWHSLYHSSCFCHFHSQLTGTPHLQPLQAPIPPLNHCDIYLPTPKMDPILLCCLKPFKVPAANRSKPNPLLVGTVLQHLPALAHTAHTFPGLPVLNFCHPEGVIPRTACSFMPWFLRVGFSLCLKYSVLAVPSNLLLPMSI